MDHGFEVSLPIVETKSSFRPLFTGYLFCIIVEQWRIINSCFGVLCLVRTGDCPCKIPYYEIEALNARADDNGIIRLPAPLVSKSRRVFKKGESVKIIAGHFAHFDGLHTGMRRGDLERVLITLLGTQREVSVARHLIKAQ
jgi:transcription antitermination factor NusG